MYQTTDKRHDVKTLTFKQLKHEFGNASLLFSGRETDTNWEARQAFFGKLKVFLSSDDAKTHKKELVDKIHEVIPSIYNTIKSVRTTLIEEALCLVEAIGTYVGDSINMHTSEAILRFLMNESSVTKKAIASRAFEATNNYLTKTRFRPKVVTFLCARAQDKNPQLREFALGYIKTVLSVHGPANKSRLIEHADLAQAIATSLQKGLVDAIPTVRSACKETYYVYEEHWPTVAHELASKLDITVQRRLGIITAHSSPTTSKAVKPFLRRTSASTIKKPASSASINKAVKSNIRTHILKPSSSTTTHLRQASPQARYHSQTSSIPSNSQELSQISNSQELSSNANSQGMGIAVQRRSGINVAQLSSATSKSAKPFLRRTSADVIKKPTSSASINKAAKSNIKTHILKPSSPTATHLQQALPQARYHSQTSSTPSNSQELSTKSNSQELSQISNSRSSGFIPSPTSSTSNEGPKVFQNVASVENYTKQAVNALNNKDLANARLQLLAALKEIGYNKENNFGF